MRNLFLLVFLVFAVVLGSSGCDDEKKKGSEYFCVEVNIHDAKYEIKKCSANDYLKRGNGSDLETCYILDEGCYDVVYLSVDGWSEPDDEMGIDVRPGVIETVYGMYESEGQMALIIVQGNIVDAHWEIYEYPSGDFLYRGPSMGGFGDEPHSYYVEAYYQDTSLKYLIHCGDVNDHNVQPAQYIVEPFAGDEIRIFCNYSETG